MTERTRREFLRGAVAGGIASGAAGLLGPDALLARVAGASCLGLPALGPLEPFELEAVVQSSREHLLRAQGWRETGVTRDAYLGLAAGIAHAFLPHQDARGAIIDPYEKREKQYSTPAFALAAGAAAAARSERDLLEPALRAMDVAVADLVAGRAADGHADFYTILLMQAERVLGPLAGAPRRASWREALATLVPEKTYQFQPGGRASNWNLVAASGEWMRHRAGLSPDVAWVEASLARQVPLFTCNGMYRDPGDPLAYDHFARLHVGLLLNEGYDGAWATPLRELLDRGAWTSLLMQSPHGELPTGGRSAEHQWNEAMQAAAFEAAASRAASTGDLVWAGAFKRAARLALGSARRWVRPGGDLWIVKNRFDPALRHGYEPYSFHSQYNLLAAAHLALAYAAADDRIAEGPCPAEIGGFAFALRPAFHKILLNAGGHYVEIETAADAHYDPTGILRIHHPEVSPQLVGDGVAPSCAYHVPKAPSRGLAFGPAWRDSLGQWYALADHGSDEVRHVSLVVGHADPDRVECEVLWRGALRGGASLVRQQMALTREALTLTTSVEGDVSGLRLFVPLLLSDGRDAFRVAVSGRTASVHPPSGKGFVFEVAGTGPGFVRQGLEEATRAGFVDAAVFETRERAVRCVVRPAS